jgi:hypothetical protein
MLCRSYKSCFFGLSFTIKLCPKSGNTVNIRTRCDSLTDEIPSPIPPPSHLKPVPVKSIIAKCSQSVGCLGTQFHQVLLALMSCVPEEETRRHILIWSAHISKRCFEILRSLLVVTFTYCMLNLSLARVWFASGC